MTYISRRTRIIVSRWTDECDADYILRAVRKRSDGRLKRHTSCEDLRAWINDYCINHEHLVDFMSDGEFLGRPPFRLYGRFIPVPILFKLVQNLQNNDTVNYGDKAEEGNEEESKIDELCKSVIDKCTCMDSSDFLRRNENSKVERSASLSRIQWEKNCLEKNLYESTSLLGRALRTLEKIDNIVDLARDESENARNEEIQQAFDEAQVVCECNLFNKAEETNVPNDSYTSQMYVKKIQDSTKCAELMRKISGLREKLKKIQECRQSVTKQIYMSQVKAAKCESPNQVTELFSFREQSQMKKLKKKLEKLISERGRLLSEMCDALKSLNTIKRSSRLSLPREKGSRGTRNDAFKCGLGESASCACGCNCSRASSEFDKFNSDSPSGGSFANDSNFKQVDPCNTFSDFSRDFSFKTPSARTFSKRRSKSSDIVCRDDENVGSSRCYKEPRRNTSASLRSTETLYTSHLQHSGLSHASPRLQKCLKNAKAETTPCDVRKGNRETKRQSRVSFASENESPCRKKFYQDDLTAFENSLTSQQQAVIQGVVQKIECRRSQILNVEKGRKRSTSSPTTGRERNSVSVGHRCSIDFGRRVKSETTMQDIEKTLRNYEQRLRNYDTLECKMEEIRQKIIEADRMKKEWGKQLEEGQKELEAEREKSSKEITKLSSENRTLKKHVQQLMSKFEAQCKKIQSLKNTAQKNWELECETEELKKEMVKYQDTLEHQRKCITKWESVVALQRTEIEKLMNHIRQLTTANNYPAECPPLERKNVSRSRSYSPEIIKPQKLVNRSKTYGKAYISSTEDETEPCYYEEYPANGRSPQENFDSGCYSSLSGRRMKW